MPAKRVRRILPSVPATPPVPAGPAPITLPQPLGWWRALAYILCLLQPSLGLGLALLYWKSEERRPKRFSRWCLALALLGLLLSGSADAVEKGMASGEWYIQPY